MALHSGLTDPNLHEPKGVAAASFGTVYVANGAGSGTWTARLPSMSGKSGYLLTNDGTNESWSNASTVRCRGSVNVSGTTPNLVSGSVNVATVTRVTGPLYRVTFTTTLANTQYQVLVQGYGTYALAAAVANGNKATSYFDISFTIHTLASLADPTSFDFVVYGGF